MQLLNKHTLLDLASLIGIVFSKHVDYLRPCYGKMELFAGNVQSVDDVLVQHG